MSVKNDCDLADIATAKAVKTLRLKHSQSHPADNQSEQSACEFYSLAMTNIAQFYLSQVSKEVNILAGNLRLQLVLEYAHLYEMLRYQQLLLVQVEDLVLNKFLTRFQHSSVTSTFDCKRCK
jgi:hypothetical protein